MGEPRDRSLRRIAGLGFAAAAAISAAIGAATPSAAAEGAVLYADSAGTISGSYIVVFKDGVSTQSVGSQVHTTTAKYGGQATYTYQAALHGYNANMTPAEANAAAPHPPGPSVQPKRARHLPDLQPKS